MDGGTDGQMDGGMAGWVGVQREGRINEWQQGRGWLAVQMAGQMDGLTDD